MALLLLLAIVGTAAFLIVSGFLAHQQPTAFPVYAMNAQFVGEEIVKFVGKGGSVVVIGIRGGNEHVDGLDRRVLEKTILCEGADILASEMVNPPLPTSELYSLAERYPKANAIVVFAGDLVGPPFHGWGPELPKMIWVGATVGGTRLKCREGIVALGFGLRQEPPIVTNFPKTPREAFDLMFEIVTPQNASAGTP